MLMNNYPKNFNEAELNDTPHDDLCEKCENGILRQLYWWKNKIRQEMTNTLECDNCDHTVENEIYVNEKLDYSRLEGVNMSYEH